MKAAAVILAGGASRRMGTPKALLEYGGETFVDRLTGIFEAVCSDVIVVLGHDADRIRGGAIRSPRFVFNPEHARGQLTSLQCGLREALPDANIVLFTPVDYPAVLPETVRALIGAYTGNEPVVVPRYGGRHGHPVLVAAQLVPEFLELPPESSAREVMHRHAAQTLYVDVNDPGVLRDVDNADAYRALLGATG